MGRGPQVRRRVVAAGVASALALSTLVFAPGRAEAAAGPAPIEDRVANVTADHLPTVQLDSGLVWTQDMIGTTVYAGGRFANTRPPDATVGTNLTARSNLLAYDIRTGDLIPGFAPAVNGEVKVVKASPDGTRLYVGGSFSLANNETRWNLAAFDARTGALISTFKAAVGGSYVNALAVTSTTVYVGGLISAGNGTTRKNLMAFSTAGQLLGWAPTTDLQVETMVAPAGTTKLIVGGRFSLVNGVSQRGLVALDRTTGAIVPWQAPSTVVNGMGTGTYKGKAGISTLTADAGAVYGTGWVYADKATGNLEGTFSASSDSGAIRWIADCHGDHYGVYSDGTTVYTTSHEHSCESMGGFPQKNPAPGNMRNATAITAAAKGTLLRSAHVNDTYADWSGHPAPAAINWYPDWYTGTASGQGQAGWSIVGNGDYISVGGEFSGLNGKAQYGLVRFAKNPSSGAKQGPRLKATAWVPTVTSVSAGRARVSIPANWDRDNLQLSYQFFRSGRVEPVHTLTQQSTFWNQPTLSFLDAGLTPGSSVTYSVRATDADGNTVTSASTTAQVSAAQLPAYANAVVEDGASLYYRLGGSGSTVPDLLGSSNGTAGTGVTVTTPGALGGSDTASAFSGTTSGLVSTSAPVAVSPEYSVELWFKTASTAGGKIAGYGSSATGISSRYDRHLYLTAGGRLVYGNHSGSVATITSAASYNDNRWHHVLATQGAAGMRLHVDGAEVGTNAAATAQAYAGYWRVGGDSVAGWPDPPPSPWFKGSVDEFAVYPTALPATAAKNHHAVATAVHAAPVPAFTTTTQARQLAVDASGSTASDGASLNYAWSWGDGSASSSGRTASHDYVADGTYQVRLTVTDSLGGTATLTRAVTVTGPPAVARDRFDRTVAPGWGTADTGGAWSGTSNLAVAQGTGNLTLPKSQTVTTLLPVSAAPVDSRFTVAVDKVADGGGVHLNHLAHRSSAGDLRLKLRFGATGTVNVGLAEVVGTTETLIANKALTGYTQTAGSALQVRFEAAPQGTTTVLRAKVWPKGQVEPAAWWVTATSDEAGLQAAGQVGFSGYGAGTMTNGPVVISVDDLEVF